MGMGQNLTTRGPQVLVLGSIYQVPFWVPIFDPQPNGQPPNGMLPAKAGCAQVILSDGVGRMQCLFPSWKLWVVSAQIHSGVVRSSFEGMV